MKKLLAIAATLAASSAFAGVKLEIRSDYVNVPAYDNNTGTQAGTEGTSLFTPTVARLYLTGNVGEAFIESGFNLRTFTPEIGMNPYTGGNDLYKTMTPDTFVDHLWIGKNYGAWTFKAGKLEMNMGGFEHQKEIHGDTYLVSAANGGVGGALVQMGAGNTTVVRPPNTGYVITPQNASGVSAAFAITENHKLEFQLTNQTNSTTVKNYTAGVPPTSENSLDRRHTMGLDYKGSVLEKMLQWDLSYTSGAADTNDAGHEQSYIAAGLRYTPIANLVFDVEYFANSDKATAATTTSKLETNSGIIEARYNINGWTPVLKYETTANKDDDNVANGDWKRDAWSVGVEYMPKADEAFRYHIAYTSQKDHDFASTMPLGHEDMTQNMIVVGFKYVGDIVK